MNAREKLDELDIFAEDMKPECKVYTKHFIIIQHPDMSAKTGTVARKVSIGVTVEDSGYLEIEWAHGFGDIGGHGKGIDKEQWENRQAVHEYLTEWELAKWQMIGPEDSELFATKTLDPEWGIR